MWVMLIIILIAWVLSPFVLIPLLISMSSKVKRKDDEIRRLSQRLAESQNGREAVPSDRPAMAGSHQLTLEDIRVSPSVEPVAEEIRTEEVYAEESHEEKRIRKPVRREREPRVKKKLETGHILFGIGVVLVFVAGLIFATSMWSIMPSIVKVTTLLGAAMFFVIVAWILEIKLKLREASVTMFVLGSAFMSLTVIAIGYFAWLGASFSLGASSRYLVISVSIWVLCLTLMFGYRLYGSIIFEIISYAASCVAFALLVRHIFNKGEIALLLTGIYMFGMLLFIHFKAADILRKISRIFTLGYVLISLLMYFAFGFNDIMSLVMPVCIANMIFIAVSSEDEEKGNPYGWLYYAVPVVGAFFIFNTSNVYRFVIPHGDVVTGVVLVLIAFFLYRYVTIKGKRRLANISSLITLLISFSICFGRLWAAMDRTHEGLSDITEVLPCLFVFAMCMIAFSVEYLRTLKPLKREDADFYILSYLISLCVFTFMSLYTFTPIPDYIGIKHSDYIGSLIPLFVICVVTLFVILLYQYKLATSMLTFRMIFTQRLGSIMLNASILISFLLFTKIPHDSYSSYVLNIPLIAAILMYQVHIRLKHNNPEGILTALILPFVLMEGIDKIVKRAFPDSDAVRINTVFEIKVLMFLSVLLIGLFVYRKLYSYNSEKRRLLIDWNLLMALVIMAAAIMTDDSWHVEHINFRAFAVLAVFVLYIAVKLDGTARKIALSVMAASLCGAYMVQDFISWNRDFESELIALAIPVFAAVLYYVIFRGREKTVSYISFALVCIFFLIEWGCISEAASKPAMPVVNAKLTIFLVVTLGASIFAFLKRSLKYDLMALALNILLMASCIDHRRGGHLAIASVICVIMIIYHYWKGRQPLSFVPLVLLLAAIAKTLDTWVMQFISTGSFSIKDGILVPTHPNHSPLCVIWIVVFAIMLALGRYLHRKIMRRADEDHSFMIDWFTILSLIPVLAVWTLGNEKFVWSVSLLMAIYLFGFYRRVNEFLNKPILTAISVCMAFAWWTQPIVRVKDLFVTELRIVGFLALVFVITKIIYKKELEGGLDFMYYSSVASVIWQSVSAIKSAKLFDVIILGAVLLAIIIVAFEKKSRRWFLLSAISLVCIFLYMSRDFWRRIVWPVYVFAVGLILIFFATRNEYRKKHPVPEEEKKKLFEGWGK